MKPFEAAGSARPTLRPDAAAIYNGGGVLRGHANSGSRKRLKQSASIRYWLGGSEKAFDRLSSTEGLEIVAKKRVKRPEGVPKIDFEEALAELEGIVGALEDGEVGLSESLARYERGVKLLRQCYDVLDGAQRRIELLTAVDEEGRPVVSPVDDSELTLAEKASRRSRRRSSGELSTGSGEGVAGGGGDIDDPDDII